MKPQDLTLEHLPFKTHHPSANGGICTIDNEHKLNRWKKGMERWPNAKMLKVGGHYTIHDAGFTDEWFRIQELRNSIEGKHAKRMKNFNH